MLTVWSSRKQLDQKDKINFKIYYVTTWLTKIAIHIMPIILRSKDSQTMKFGQFIECNTISIFLEKSYAKCGGETSPRPFSKKSKLILF